MSLYLLLNRMSNSQPDPMWLSGDLFAVPLILPLSEAHVVANEFLIDQLPGGVAFSRVCGQKLQNRSPLWGLSLLNCSGYLPVLL